MRRKASVDGQAIDPSHLATVLDDDLRLQLPDGLRAIERGLIIDAARRL